MIVAPEWSTLQGITNGLDTINPVERQKAIERTLHIISDALPDVQAVRIFDVESQNLIVRAATDLTTKAVYPIGQASVIQQAIETQQTMWTGTGHQWVAPLISREQVRGIFEVVIEELDDDWITWLSIIAEQIAAKLYLVEKVQAIELTDEEKIRMQMLRLVEANRIIATTEEYDEAATATIFAAGDTVQSVVITMFSQAIGMADGEQGILASNQRFVRAIATHNTSELVSLDESMDKMPNEDYIQYLLREVPIVVQNIEHDTYLTEWTRQKAQEHQAKQVLSLGLIGGRQVVGTLDLFLPHNEPLTDVEIDFFTSIANQLGTTIQSKRQLQRSTEAQHFASQLVITNKALAIANTYEEMATAILRDAPQTIQGIAIALYNRSFTKMGTPNNLQTQTIVTRKGVIDEAFVDVINVTENARITYFLSEFLEGNLRQLWNADKNRTPVIAQQLVDCLIENTDAKFISAFGLNTGKDSRGVIVLASTEDLTESMPQYNSLRAIADQLSSVIENRILLNQTSEALNLIRSQYETTGRVFRSTNLPNILESLLDFAGKSFSRAQLVTTEVDEVTRIVAQVDETGANTVHIPVQLSDYPAYQTLNVLEALEVRNVQEDPFITDAERATLAENQIVAFVILPILSNQKLSGLIMLMSEQVTRVEPDRLRAMRSLADQVGVVLENRNLLQSVENNLRETEVLYEANRNILRTQDNMDILHVLQDNLAPEASTICQMSIVYNPRNRNEITSLYLDYELTKQSARVLHEHLPTTQEQRIDIYRFLRQVQDTVLFSPNGNVVFNNPLQLIMSRYQIRSYATFALKERGQISTVIFVIFDTPRQFTTSVRQLYEAITDQVAIALENQKLLRETQIAADKLSAQVDALQAISDLAVQINRTQSAQKLLDTSVRAMVESLSIDHSSVVLFDEERINGTVISEYPGNQFTGMSVGISDNPILRPDADPHSAIVIDDVENDPLLTDNMRNILMSGGIKSIILVPLLGQQDEPIGSVGLDVYHNIRHFEENEVQTAQTIAAQMAVGLQNVRLLEDARQRAEQLQHISDFSAITQSTMDPEGLIDSALSNIPRLLDVTHMTISLYDEARQALILEGGWQENNSFRTSLDAGEEVPLQNTIVGYVFENGRHSYIPNIRTNVGLRYPHSRTIASLLCMPIVNQGKVLGVASIGSHRGSAYTNTDIAVFQQLVNQMAVALYNAKTYTESQRVARNKTIANEIAVKLQREKDIQHMINLTMNEVSKVIGAKRGRVRLQTQTRTQDEEVGD